MRQLLSSVLCLCLLVPPLTAQEEALYGTWEATVVDEQIGEIAIRLTFEEDGAFEFNQVIQVKDDFLSRCPSPRTTHHGDDLRPRHRHLRHLGR